MISSSLRYLSLSSILLFWTQARHHELDVSFKFDNKLYRKGILEMHADKVASGKYGFLNSLQMAEETRGGVIEQRLNNQ